MSTEQNFSLPPLPEGRTWAVRRLARYDRNSSDIVELSIQARVTPVPTSRRLGKKDLEFTPEYRRVWIDGAWYLLSDSEKTIRRDTVDEMPVEGLPARLREAAERMVVGQPSFEDERAYAAEQAKLAARHEEEQRRLQRDRIWLEIHRAVEQSQVSE